MTHVLTSSEADFEEMLLHDISTNALFFGYIFSDMVPVGTMIAWLHDTTDIAFHIAKFANNSNWPDFAPLPFITGQLLWLYFRLGCFPHLIWTTHNAKFAGDDGREQFQPYLPFNVAFLSILYLMHWLWFYMF